jgi:hypothetical protein
MMSQFSSGYDLFWQNQTSGCHHLSRGGAGEPTPIGSHLRGPYAQVVTGQPAPTDPLFPVNSSDWSRWPSTARS